MIRLRAVVGVLLVSILGAHAIAYAPKYVGEELEAWGAVSSLEQTFAERFAKTLREHAAKGVPGPEYGFVPTYLGSVIPGNSTELSWSSPCFKTGSASISLDRKGKTVTATIKLDGRKSLLCDEAYFLATPFHYEILDMALVSTAKVKWTQTTPSELVDLEEAGIRIFRFPKSATETITAAYDTLMLFLGALKGGAAVPKDVAERNLKFLKEYAHCDMPPRAKSKTLIDESLLQSGDMLGIVRLDGLDPLIMWGTGSHLGHTAVVLRDEEGVWILESQVKSNYWPQDRVQRTRFAQWMEWAEAASYNVIWIPLRDDLRRQFDSAAASAEFGRLAGLLYGYPNLLFGWIDTPEHNFPHPLSAELLAVALSIADPVMRRLSSLPSLWNGALRLRLKLLGGEDLGTAELIAEAERRGMTFGELMAVPEQDTWEYPGQRAQDGSWLYPPGPAMVCNTFVCRMWKAGGIVPDGVSCSEFTPFDNYELALFNASAHSNPGCVDGDQISCQLLGDYTITLPRANSVVPFPGMREHCPGTAPDYEDRIAVTKTC